MMKIAIVNTLPVPSGNASVNRFLGYAKEMAKAGDYITVLSSAAFEDSIVDGVDVHSCGRGRSIVGALFAILSTIRREKYDAVILVSNSLLLIYPLWFICRINGVKLLQEKSEFPFVLMKKGVLRRLWAKYYTSTTYRLFDGLIVMTHPLMEYFKDKVRKNCELIEVPMTVDMERFDIKKTEKPFYGDYIAYCGDMAGNKDGVANLIEAFTIAARTVKSVKLVLIGGTSNENELNKLKGVAQKECPERIVFTGRVSRDEIPQLLTDAKALALARPSSLQSTGGFPTKLGEYLSTGNPVVVTAVGDIPIYLNDTNSYIVEPDNNQAFADRIVEIFNDFEKARGVGCRGKDAAEKNFNSRVQAPRIREFILSMP